MLYAKKIRVQAQKSHHLVQLNISLQLKLRRSAVLKLINNIPVTLSTPCSQCQDSYNSVLHGTFSMIHFLFSFVKGTTDHK